MFRLSLARWALLAVLSCLLPAVARPAPAADPITGRRVALVDDGTCPAGQIKQVTGGNNMRHGEEKGGAKRTRACVYR